MSVFKYFCLNNSNNSKTMKISILYYSQTGKTREMAEMVANGMRTVDGMEVGIFDIENVDVDFLHESKAVVFGTPTYLANTPTYLANTCWQIKKWFDEIPMKKINLGGKLGAAFSTANFVQGGGDTAILTLVNHMLVTGMLVYSSGSSQGLPYIHLGAVAVKNNFEESKKMLHIFGERIAAKAVELFEK